jgi:type IV secretion system protein VirB10
MTTEITADPVFQENGGGPEPKQSAASILQVSRPGVTRYKRSAIIAGASGLALMVTIGIVYAFVLDHSTQTVKKEDAPNLLADQKPAFGDKLAANYSDAAAYGPAPGTTSLPANDMDESTMVPGQAAQQNAQRPVDQRPPLTPAQQRAERAREIAIQQEMAARSGNVMFSSSSGQIQSAYGGGDDRGVGDMTDSGMGADGGADRSGEAAEDPSSQNMQNQKRQFIATSGIAEDYIKGSLQAARSKYEVKAGSIISGALLTALNSDLPGEVIATITENVYDHVTGRHLLIPQGARLIGSYDSKVAYKQSRALVVWNRIIFPNGSSINIGSMTGTDGTGASGVKDRVNNHFGAKISGVALSTAIAVGAAAAESAGSRDNQLMTAGGGAVAQEASRVGQEIVTRELNRQPTITVRAGFRVRVLVSKDIILEPYQGQRSRPR